MPVINRTLAIVTLKKPFVDWLNSLPDRGDIDWEEAAMETAQPILLPDETLDDDELTDEVMSRYWHRIAISIFETWVLEPGWWPKNFSAEQFVEWFGVQLVDSPIVDLVKEPIEREEY